MEATRPVVPLIGAAAPRELLAPASASASMVGSGRVTGTDSRLLFEALAAVYSDLGFEVVADAVFQDVVCARIVEPTSLVDCGRVLSDLGQRPASYATMKRVLRRVVADGYRGRIATACFAHATVCVGT